MPAFYMCEHTNYWYMYIQGVYMTVGGEQRLIRGGVLFALADTLAAHSLGGFKVGVGFSLRKCRMCLATNEQLSQHVSWILHL